MFATLSAFLYLVKNGLWNNFNGNAGFCMFLAGTGELAFYMWMIGMLFGRW